MAVASSSKMTVDPAGLSMTGWEEQFASAGKPADLQTLTNDLGGMDEDTVVFDCTAADEPCDFYAKWMEQGVHVITPNKKLHSGPIDRYAAVRALQAQGAAHYFYEVPPHVSFLTAVCAFCDILHPERCFCAACVAGYSCGTSWCLVGWCGMVLLPMLILPLPGLGLTPNQECASVVGVAVCKLHEAENAGNIVYYCPFEGMLAVSPSAVCSNLGTHQPVAAHTCSTRPSRSVLLCTSTTILLHQTPPQAFSYLCRPRVVLGCQCSAR